MGIQSLRECLVGWKMNSFELEFLKFEEKAFYVVWFMGECFQWNLNSSNLWKISSLPPLVFQLQIRIVQHCET